MKTKAQLLAEMKANPDDRRHGTYTGYVYGCRCEGCRKAGQDAYDRRMERKLEKLREKREAEKERKAKKARKKSLERNKPKKDVCTVSDLYKPLMGKPSIGNAYGICCWCGAPNATNKHHIVPRSAGKMVVGGHELSKPTVLLCGNGNVSGCHGKAHARKLHFRWHEPERGDSENWEKHPYGCGYLEGIELDEPTKYQDALEIEKGWRKV